MSEPFEFDSPRGIEEESLRRVEGLLHNLNLAPGEMEIAKRVAHATGDPEIARTLVFGSSAVEAGLRAIRAGEAIVTDVRMVQVGIDGPRVRDLGIQVHCLIHDLEVGEEAKRLGTTRARIAMRKAARGLRGGIVAIGNAPTALFEILALIAAREASPALVIGVPVGFVGAQESKDLLLASPIPHITLPGTRGGSPIAVSIVNALLRLAKGVV